MTDGCCDAGLRPGDLAWPSLSWKNGGVLPRLVFDLTGARVAVMLAAEEPVLVISDSFFHGNWPLLVKVLSAHGVGFMRPSALQKVQTQW